MNNLEIFLDMASRGCVSGRMSEWPQLKPACRYALDTMAQLREENKRLKEALAPLAVVAEKIGSRAASLSGVGLWSHTANEDAGNYSLTVGHALAAKDLLDSLDE